MTSRLRKFCLVIPILLALSGCSAAGSVNEASLTSGGTIELAVSETCAEGSDTQCVSVNGENVILPSAFERAGVEDAAVAEGEGQSAVDVTFNSDGAAVLQTLTEQAAQAGDTARLVMKIGGEIKASVAVMGALKGNHIQFILSPDDNSQEVVDLIQGG